MSLLPFFAVAHRDLLRMLRHRGRLLSGFVRPMIWFLVIGAGLGALIAPNAPGSYQRYLVPGVLGMTMLFGAMLIALSVVYDKEFGVMRLLVTAPLPHYWIVLAKIASATLLAMLQAAVILIIFALAGYVGAELSGGLLLFGCLGTALTCASLGIIVAVWTSSLDNFAAVMNFVIFPVFFLSGALYPVDSLPPALNLFATLNPFTYGVDLLKHACLGNEASVAGAEFSVALDLGVLFGFSALATFVACLRFSHETRLGVHRFLRAS